MDILVSFSAAFAVLVGLVYVRKAGYVVITNPFFLLLLLFWFYFQLPAVFVCEINNYYSWGISASSILYAQLITSCMTIFLALVLLFVKVDRPHAIHKFSYHYSCSSIVKLFWVIILFYLLAIALFRYVDGGLEMTSNYTGESGDPYKIKNIAYLLVPVSVILFFHKKSILIFLPNIILAMLDVLSGSRTSALIVLVPIMVSMCLLHKKLYVIQIICMVALLIIIGIIRSDNVVQEVPWYLNAIGEFRETYITLPLLIENDHYVGVGSGYTMLASSMLALLQPIRSAILASTILPGDYIYQLVGRGYGLGANVLTEALFYGYFWLFIIPVILLGLGFGMLVLINKFELPIVAIFCSMYIVFARLIIREGVFYNGGLFLFVVLVYVVPVIVLNSNVWVRVRRF